MTAEAQIVGPLSRWSWEYIWLRDQGGPQLCLPPFHPLPLPGQSPGPGKARMDTSVHSFSVILSTYYAPGAVRVAWVWAAKSKNKSAPISVECSVVLSKLLDLSYPV